MKTGIYLHYKGGLYLLIGIGEHSETGEKLVIYIPMTGAHRSGPRIRCRPLEMWNEMVDTPEGKKPRFLHVGDYEIPEDLRPKVSTDVETT